MAVIPTGYPYWVRATGFGNYGGNVNKRNHLLQGAIDPETDVTAEQLARLSADMAGVARVAPFATLTITCNDTSPAAPTVNMALLATGVNLVGYAGDSAPSGFPSAARVSDGKFTLTFGSSYSDDYSVSGSFDARAAMASQLSTALGSAVVSRDSATQLTVAAFDAAGAADADAVVSVVVYTGGAS